MVRKGRALMPGNQGSGTKQHEGEPTRPAGLDEMAMAGTHRVAIDAARVDTRAAAALYCVIEPDDDRSLPGKPRHQQKYKPACEITRVPAGVIENLMVGRECLAHRPSGHAQADTVLLPGASRAPVTRTITSRQVRVENAPRKGSSQSMRNCGTGSPISLEGPSECLITTFEPRAFWYAMAAFPPRRTEPKGMPFVSDVARPPINETGVPTATDVPYSVLLVPALASLASRSPRC